MAKQAIKITDAEWALMQVLWDKGPLKMADLAASLEPVYKWNRTTVLTLASRLEHKGILGTDRSQKAYIYAPLVSEKEAQSARLQELLALAFHDSAYELVRALVDQRLIKGADLKKLRERAKSIKS
ncbi:MAG: BlaI/MecI/CopY family transcriptional regulator [Oscillospiraceae bacterium]|nr:BlaI/MecI/CopY family transcriptional regulator [Oscillospiraceae bacterium]MDD4368115.1 BlaI/MecI/CopY family transcriptional regulator [Oscillospiraceae bacterium]